MTGTYSPALAAEAKQLAETRRAAVARGHGVAAEPTRGTADSQLDTTLGQHGAVVTGRELSANGKVYGVGSILSPELVLSWPPRNRHALKAARRVAYFSRPIATTPAPTEGATDAAV
jgi:hypothetical protein